MNPFYTFPISEHLEQTPEGFLICRDVPIAMAGTFDYAGFEVDPKLQLIDNKISIERLPEDIFRPATIASAEGKPVLIYRHPSLQMDGGFVTPETAKMFTVGHAQNVRAGQNGSGNKLLADLFLTDRETIDAVLRNEIREVSPGFASKWQQEVPGKARNIDIVFNHVALVRQGRAGAELAIQDSKPQEVKKMPGETKRTWLTGLMEKAFGKATLDEAMPAEEAKGDPADALKQVLAELEALKAKIAGVEELKAKLDELLAHEAEEKELMAKAAQDKKDPAAKVDPAAAGGAVADPAVAGQDCNAGVTHDSAVISAAEIVAPGCNVKDKGLVKAALAAGLKNDARETIEKALGGVTLDSLDDKAAVVVLRSIAGTLTEARKAAALPGTAIHDAQKPGSLRTDPRDHNEFMKNYYSQGK